MHPHYKKTVAHFAGLCLFTALTIPALEAHGKRMYIPQIPSAEVVGSEGEVCGTCHAVPDPVKGKGKAPRNAFGDDFEEADKKWTKDLADKDADGDGFTNGEELGDPQGTWVYMENVESDRTFVSFPGDKDSPTPVCNDTVQQGDEECDGTDFDGKTCADFDNKTGLLKCTIECKIDSSGCAPAASQDMGGEDMGAGGDMDTNGGVDMTTSTPTNGATTIAPDQGSVVPTSDMGVNNGGGSDMGGGGSTNTATGTMVATTTPNDDDEGCAQTGGGAPVAPLGLMALVGGLVWGRRRLRNQLI